VVNPSARGVHQGAQAAAGADSSQQAPTYVLFRMIDSTVQRGHKYRYKVLLYLADPNFPPLDEGTKDIGPDPALLDAAAEARVKALRIKEAETKMRQSWLPADPTDPKVWSEPSPVISVPDPTQLAVGEATAGTRTLEPKVKTLVLQWDDTFAAAVPGFEEIERGAVLNFKKDADAIHPLKSEFVPLTAYDFHSGAVLADVRGGEVVKPGKDQLTAPSHAAFIDPNGNLVVHDELEDIRLMQRYSTVEPPAPTPERNTEGRGERRGSPGSELLPRAGRRSGRPSRDDD
jgi:hypothetical protein